MSSVSTRKGSDAQAFLARYQSLLGRIMQLASETGAEQIWEALMQRPYLLPQPLSDTPEGVVLGRELASLGEERRELEIGVAEIDEQVRRILVARSRGAAAAPASGETPDPTVSPEHLTRLFQDFSSKRGFGFIDLGNEGLGFRIERAADIEAAAERELVEASEEAAALEAMPAAEQSESEDAADEAEPVAEEASVEAASVEAAVDDDPANGPIILKVPSPAPPAPSRAPPLFRGARTTEEWSVGGGRSRPTGETNVTSGRTLGGSRPRPTRWVNAEIEDHAPSEPLDPATTYTMAFSIDVTQKASAVATTKFSDKLVFAKGVKEVALTVQLDSDDFDIPKRTRPLRVLRQGRSRGKARFDITPRRTGRCALKATLHKDGNFIQQLEITVSVGRARAAPVQVEATGRPPTAAVVLQPRDIGLSIEPAARGGYDCIVWGAVAARAHLPIQQNELATAVDALQLELLKVVAQTDDAGEFIFQRAIDIPEAHAASALRTMANAGALLFSDLFYHPAAGADARGLGDYIRRMATDSGSRLRMQILALTTPIPWDLLYVGDASDAAVLDWDLFLGMRHIVEQIPLQNTLSIADCTIPSDKPSLAVSVNLNSGIDTQFGATFVQDQEAYWATAAARRRRLRVTPRKTSTEVVRALGDARNDDQIVYFYCHASTVGIATGSGGPNKSVLELTDGEMSLGDLNRNAPTTVQLRGMPLVFINACESAELSPAFYDGFVPYFMAKGARGVVGTECQTPALFAANWHDRFFDRFLDGAPLGEMVLAMRREFQREHHNPLGLLYAVHCDADTRIQPSLLSSPVQP